MAESRSLQYVYKKWAATATPEQIALVDAVYLLCEKNYIAGGDSVVECFTPQEILRDFRTVEAAKSFCGLKVEQATNCRWGEDSDPELETQRRFNEGW